ncbi:DUF2332 domain-containing protein [Natrialba sp. SSL1]|uniref:DUF2332 domain-containing protein n=1 Tax=Natrialba sp. SSL1 TaxID=1869245 RepID=UPI0008F8D963|nr:DUF2332 domain-containing protein [Natrialba sp. SSL1]OIB55880.1 hypothetical protein BBD46_20430 [Natrialba sp. SSL1]
MDTPTAFERYAAWVSEISPLYATITAAVADDSRLLAIAAEARAEQPEPELLLAAVHSLLLDDEDHPLANLYRSCDGDYPDPAVDPVPVFRDFCLENEDRLRSLIATRRCQTNAIGRSAMLAPAFEHVARTAEQRSLAQVEIGASAGLNLNWDRYQYDMGDAGRFGNSDSPVTISTMVRGDRRPPLAQELPSVAHRCGIDLNTLDVTDEADARWLRALIPPAQDRRHERLETALDIARENQPPLKEGDVLDELPRQLSDAPTDAELVVFSTHVLYQLDDETIAALRALLSDHSSERRVRWLSIDPNEGLGTPTYRLVTFSDGEATETQLAQFESYGEWVQWTANTNELV